MIFTAVALFAAATASAIDTGKQHPIRIALLASPESFADRRDLQMSDQVRNLLRGELRELGYDAFLTGDRVADLQRNGHPEADFYLDVAGADGGRYPMGGVGVAGGGGFVDVALVVSRVAASITVYDGRTTELIDTIDLQKRTTAIAPAALGVGRRSIWGFIGLPFEWAQYRAGIRAIARDAARQIDEALRP